MSSPILLDRPEQQIAVALTWSYESNLSQRVFRRECQIAWRAVRDSLPRSSKRVTGAAASSLVRAAAQAIEDGLRLRAARYSALHWLWMLRRVPQQVFEGRLASTAGYDRRLAEVLTGDGAPQRTSLRQLDRVCAYDVSDRAMRELGELCEGARLLSDFHRAHRWCGKGAEVEFFPDSPPVEYADEGLRESVELYDQRQSAAAGFFARFGTDFDLRAHESDDDVALLVRDIVPSELELPAQLLGATTEGHADQIESARLVARFFPRFVSLREFDRLEWTQARTPFSAALLLLLRASAYLTVAHRARMHGVFTRGYLLLDDNTLQRCLGFSLGEANAAFRARLHSAEVRDVQTAIRLIEEHRGSVWPLIDGPLLRRDGRGIVCVDLAAATSALEKALETPLESGGAANSRAEHFEAAVQRRIDETPWRPSDPMRGYIRRTLRVAGAAVTDVDALGVNGKTLLLVSCKSSVYKATHDIGDYRAIRNSASLLDDAVRTWNRVTATLLARPSGDNYDFTGYDRVIGVVCTPGVVWVPIGQATAEVAPGLLAVSSLAELAQWTGSSSHPLSG